MKFRKERSVQLYGDECDVEEPVDMTCCRCDGSVQVFVLEEDGEWNIVERIEPVTGRSRIICRIDPSSQSLSPTPNQTLMITMSDKVAEYNVDGAFVRYIRLDVTEDFDLHKAVQYSTCQYHNSIFHVYAVSFVTKPQNVCGWQ